MSTSRAIGGYFGAEPGAAFEANAGPIALPARFASAVAVQSGRVALSLALPSTPATLWLPAYFCPPVARALAATGWRLMPYSLAADWGPNEAVQPGLHDRVLLVDYFGLSGEVVRRGVARFGAGRVVVDASLALFAEALPGVPTAYSPRKFTGLPDGGLLVGLADHVDLAAPDEAASAWRSRHLRLRAAGDVQGGRAPYAEAEASLDDDLAPRRMSALTLRLLAAFDFDATAQRRRANYRRLAEGLRARGFEVLALDADAVPLCCPVPGLDPAVARPRLAAEGVFCAAYWPGLALPAADVHGRRLAEATTFLPCDQRYDAGDIDFILARIDALKDRP